jgi:hypothetical protein
LRKPLGRADSLDFRDRKYAPAIDRAPAAELLPRRSTARSTTTGARSGASSRIS